MIKASVLIANFNGEKYIEQCIQSLESQTFKEFEIIFFDDCSSDNSVKIVEKFKNVKIIRNKSHSSTGSFNQINAYKKAFENSSGEVIFTLDSDDFFYPNKIERVLKYYESDVKMAFDLPTIVEENKQRDLKNKSKNYRISFFPFITQQSCMSVKREIFLDLVEKVNIKKFENVWFDFRAGIYSKYKFGKMFIIDDHLTYYRITKTNVSYKYRYLTKLWWKRRLDYHNYAKLYCDKNDYKYYSNIDYILTQMFNYFNK